jgi:hypothetical protein
MEATTTNLTRERGAVININATAYQVVYERITSDTITINATSPHHNPIGNCGGNMVATPSITQASMYG